jgi:class 3 adenylate cyclase
VDDGSGALTATGLSCGSCGTQLPPNSKFCNECGAPVIQVSRSAEYKQVTVLFADVVHSMDIAAVVGAERLREIMSELVDKATAVVKRYRGTVAQFTGDGIMAVFGAPVALEDHAIRACLAALGVQEHAKRLAVEVQDRDGVDLQLRVGLNSGEVIAGEVGSTSLGYTTIGEQVGMAQRMQSVAPRDGVMLSDSTARLVEHAAVLVEPELVSIKRSNEPVTAHRLLGVASEREASGYLTSEGLLVLAGSTGRPGLAVGQRLHRIVQQPAAQGVPQPQPLEHPVRGPGGHRRLQIRAQPPPPAFGPGLPNAGRVRCGVQAHPHPGGLRDQLSPDQTPDSKPGCDVFPVNVSVHYAVLSAIADVFVRVSVTSKDVLSAR